MKCFRTYGADPDIILITKHKGKVITIQYQLSSYLKV